jgi:hypothetical protein
MRINKDAKLRAIRPNYLLTDIFSVDDIKRKHAGHFFSPDTMRFFKSRLIQDVYPTNNGLVYFVTSEKACFRDETRVFNVRSYNIKNDSFDTIATLSSRAVALTTALNMAYGETILTSEAVNA